MGTELARHLSRETQCKELAELTLYACTWLLKLFSHTAHVLLI